MYYSAWSSLFCIPLHLEMDSPPLLKWLIHKSCFLNYKLHISFPKNYFCYQVLFLLCFSLVTLPLLFYLSALSKICKSELQPHCIKRQPLPSLIPQKVSQVSPKSPTNTNKTRNISNFYVAQSNFFFFFLSSVFIYGFTMQKALKALHCFWKKSIS